MMDGIEYSLLWYTVRQNLCSINDIRMISTSESFFPWRCEQMNESIKEGINSSFHTAAAASTVVACL